MALKLGSEVDQGIGAEVASVHQSEPEEHLADLVA